MKIGFDAKRAFMNYSGLGNYSRSVIESLAQFYSSENYFLFTPEKTQKLFEQILLRKNIEVVSSGGLLKPFWRSYSQVNNWNKLKLDIYHGLSNELPFGLNSTKTKKIVTIHDIIFKQHPEFYSFSDRNIYDLKTKHAIQWADKIICISNQTKKEIIRYYNASEKKISVIYPALPNHITRMISINKIEAVKEKYNLPEKYILYTGTIEKRKNLFTVIKALDKLGENAPPLIAVGRETKYLVEIKNYLSQTTPKLNVTFIHSATNEELNVLYSLSTIFIYISLFEGFGIPLIEAAAHGIPSITTKDSCMEEAAGTGAIFVNPKSVDETANAILKLMNDSKYHNQLSAVAIVHASKFNTKNLSADLMKTYSNVIN